MDTSLFRLSSDNQSITYIGDEITSAGQSFTLSVDLKTYGEAFDSASALQVPTPTFTFNDTCVVPVTVGGSRESTIRQ